MNRPAALPEARLQGKARRNVANDRFLSLFYEEARELLQALESGLMDLEARQGDRAHLDRTFRAAHTLKGAAGMVGLATIAEFTHGVEAVLDRIRDGRLGVGPGVISTLLAGKDHMVRAIEAGEEGRPIAVPPGLDERLAAFARGEVPPDEVEATAGTAAPAGADGDSPASLPVDDGSGGRADSGTRNAADPDIVAPVERPDDPPAEGRTQSYRIHLTPHADLLRKGVNPLGLLDELRELGRASLTTHAERVPPLDDLDPGNCHLAWTIDLETGVDLARLEEVFLFLGDPGQVTIERADDPATVTDPVANAGPRPVTSTPDAAGARGKEAKALRVRVDAGQLDELVGMAGELAILVDGMRGLRDVKGVGPWVGALEALEQVGRQLRDTTLDLGMVPVEELFVRFPRVVRDLAGRSGKRIALRIEGEETRLDRTIIERLAEPMIHLIRNAVDHGLESPEERVAAGKAETGRITIGAGYEGDRVAIRIEDDGRGLDRERIARKAIAAGLLPTGTEADDPRVGAIIFEPGFSTRDEAGELSGRGVGLDVVRDAIRGLRGTVALRSVPGRGATFLIHLPLTLAMIDGLLVEADDARFVVPIAQVAECVAVAEDAAGWSMGRHALTIRDELVPLVSLSMAPPDGPAPLRREVLLTEYAEQRVGVLVDRLLGRVQAVIQPLDEGLGHLHRYSGATILGDGTVCLVLDLASVVAEAHLAGMRAAWSVPHPDTVDALSGARGLRP